MRETLTGGYQFGTFKGVFTPSILTILGVIMYLRAGWVLGNVGLAATLLIVTASSAITFLTGLSVSSLATNMRVRGGGAYYMLSRSLGVETGGAIGIPLFLAQAVSIAFYVAGFAESITAILPFADVRIVGLTTLAVLALITYYSADFALRTQYAVMACIAVSLASFFLGCPPDPAKLARPEAVSSALGFWPVLAVFFPAVTGILSGVGMSGDLKDPSRSLPTGTIAAVLTGYAIYMSMFIFLNAMAIDPEALRADPMIVQKTARWGALVLPGLWAASLSSAVGCLLAAPRTLQALARDGVLPRFLGKGYGTYGDPRVATVLAVAIGAAGLLLGDINLIAPVLTMFFLTTYGLLNLSAGLEELIGNPSWRPTFRVPAVLSLIGFAACLGMMFMINPGATFVAMAFVLAVYYVMKRRALKARWGDMRVGVLMFGVRAVLRRLATATTMGHNWRPNLLVLVGVPTRRWHLIELTDAISQNRSLVTVALVVAESMWTADRAERLRKSIRRYLESKGVEAHVRIQPGEDLWSGIRELVRAYGFGPLVPNTVLIGASEKPETAVSFARLVRLVDQTCRNLMIVRDSGKAAPADCAPRIDIWWRGGMANAAFMLALACLVRKGSEWADARLVLRRLIEKDEGREEAERAISAFLKEARVRAEIDVRVRDERSSLERIAEVSCGASLVFLGLRKPGERETDEAYAEYYCGILRSCAPLRLTVLALAAETVDFHNIFQSEP